MYVFLIFYVVARIDFRQFFLASRGDPNDMQDQTPTACEIVHMDDQAFRIRERNVSVMASNRLPSSCSYLSDCLIFCCSSSAFCGSQPTLPSSISAGSHVMLDCKIHRELGVNEPSRFEWLRPRSPYVCLPSCRHRTNFHFTFQVYPSRFRVSKRGGESMIPKNKVAKLIDVVLTALCICRGQQN